MVSRSSQVVLIIGMMAIGWLAFDYFQDNEEPKTETSSSDNLMTELWCLDLFDEKDRKALGYLKGDYLDELVCREDVQNMMDDLDNVPYSKVKEFFENP